MVLQDCETAIAKHRDDLQGEEFRISWVAILTLLRAVGHVLEKVDAKADPHLKAELDKKWAELRKTRPAPEIFWEFIEKQRNLVLKQYDLGVSRRSKVGETILEGRQVQIHVELSLNQGSVSVAKADVSRMSSGFFAGQDERVVARSAAKWWRETLDELDEAVRQRKQ
jgi:hypothetical protein